MNDFTYNKRVNHLLGTILSRTYLALIVCLLCGALIVWLVLLWWAAQRLLQSW